MLKPSSPLVLICECDRICIFVRFALFSSDVRNSRLLSLLSLQAAATKVTRRPRCWSCSTLSRTAAIWTTTWTSLSTSQRYKIACGSLEGGGGPCSQLCAHGSPVCGRFEKGSAGSSHHSHTQIAYPGLCVGTPQSEHRGIKHTARTQKERNRARPGERVHPRSVSRQR